MTDITIPPEALEAAARALADAYYRHCSDGRLTLADTDDTPEDWMPEARAAIAAAINAWPGVNLDAVRCGTIILHLPKKETSE